MSIETTIFVAPTGIAAVAKHIAGIRAESGDVVSQLCDIYGMGLLMADYECRVPAFSNHILNDKTVEQVIHTLAHAQYTKLGSTITTPAVIAVHHQELELHALVRIMDDGDIHVFHHTKPRDQDDEHFVLEMNKPMRDELGVKVGRLDQPTTYQATSQEDAITVITEIRLGKFVKGPGVLEVTDSLLLDHLQMQLGNPAVNIAVLLSDAEKLARGIPLSALEECLKAADALTNGVYHRYYSSKHFLPTLTDEQKIALGIPVRVEIPRQQ